MTYATGWQHDVFVSYARVDDEPLPGATDGWVCMLTEALRVMLAAQLGRAEVLAMWRDVQQLEGNAALTPDILTAVRGSATLLIVLSEGYLASPWCLDEYREFVMRAGENTRRVFMVELTPIERARKPPVLDDRTGYPFWIRDRGSAHPRTLGVPVPTPGETEYYRRLNRLAVELANELRRLKSAA